MNSAQRILLPSIFAAALGFTFQFQVSAAASTSDSQAITLAKSAEAVPEISSAPRIGNLNAPMIDHRNFERTKLGESSAPQLFTLEFHQSSRIASISTSGDFKITGGNCSEGHIYASGDTCSLDMIFTPKGPGHRIGRLTVTHTASVLPFVTTTGGEAYGPVVSFIPAQITTLPGTYINGTQPTANHGLLLAPQALNVDGGDNLYVADTGNNLIRYGNSTGILSTIAGGGTDASLTYYGSPGGALLNAPSGVAVDPTGNVWFSDTGNSIVRDVSVLGQMQTTMGGGTTPTNCSVPDPCNADGAELLPFTTLVFDLNANLFLNAVYGSSGADPAELDEYTGKFSYLYHSEYYGGTNTFPMAVDDNDNVYYAFDFLAPSDEYTNACEIRVESFAFTTGASGGTDTLIGGNRTCGFSGDGGLATGASISSTVEGLALDAAGNLYFSDSGNNRIRRIDAATGIIRTIAGNGIAGLSGDGGSATSAALNAPFGVTVDSQGRVYATSLVPSTTTGPSPAVIREIGINGQLTFPAQAVGLASSAQTVLVSNSGNETLNFTHAAITSGNTGDFTIDPNSTSCNFTLPLYAGRSCTIGVIFTPSVAGARAAVLSVLDDTVTGVNMVQLNGVGSTTATLAPASLTFASTAVGSPSAAQTATLTNTGTGALTIGSIGFVGLNVSSFAETTTCGSTLAVGANCTISVVFKPTAAGSLSAALVVTDNAGSGQQSVALAGTGASAAATPVLSPTSLTFASETVGSSSAGQQIKLTNSGTAALGVTSIKLTGTNAGDFAINTNCGSTVNAGAACLVNAVFKPTAAGTRTASVTYITSAGTLTVALTGTGTAAAAKPILSPTPVAFSSQTVATASAAKAFTLTNAGTVSMTIGSFGFTGANAGDFTQTRSCGATLAAGANCTISVVFKPAAMGARSATLVVSTSAGSASAAVSGNGVAAAKVALASGANPVAKGQILSLAVQVGAEANGQASALANVPPTGQVQLMEGGRVLAEGSLGDSAVTLRVGDLSPGLHVLRAVYLGDAHYGVSVSNAINEMVSEGVTVPGPARPGRLD